MLQNSYINIQDTVSAATNKPQILVAYYGKSLLFIVFTCHCSLDWEEVTLLPQTSCICGSTVSSEPLTGTLMQAENSGAWEIFWRPNLEVVQVNHLPPHSIGQKSVSWSYLPARKAGKCKAALFPIGKGNQLGKIVFGDLCGDWKRLLAQQRKTRERRKWHCMEGKSHNAKGLQFLCLSRMKENVDGNIKKSWGHASAQVTEPPLCSGSCGYNAHHWAVTQLFSNPSGTYN